MTNRLSGLDSLRAMACLMIVLHHVGLQTDTGAVGPTGIVLGAFAARGSYGVVIFFVLSGFLLSLPFWRAFRDRTAMPSLTVYWTRRLARILPAFYLAMAASLLLALVLGVAKADADTASRFAAGILFLSPFSAANFFPVELNGPLWSIAFEVFAYAGLPMMFALIAALPNLVSTPVRAGALVTVVIVLSMALNALHLGTVSASNADALASPLRVLGDEFFARFSIYGMFAVFACGSLAGAAHVYVATARRKGGDMIAAISLLCLAMLTMGLGLDALDIGQSFAMPYEAFPLLPMAICTFLVAAPRSVMVGRLLDWGPSRYIAAISFGIYIYHMPILHLVSLWVVGETLTASSAAQVWTVMALTLAATICAAHLSYHRLEQPCIAWARRLEPRLHSDRSASKTA